MDATRYFEEMHRAMAAQKTASQLARRPATRIPLAAMPILELRRNPADGSSPHFVLYDGTQRSLNFQLFRKGWQLCHNAAGELTGLFPFQCRGIDIRTEPTSGPFIGMNPLTRTKLPISWTRSAAMPGRTSLPLHSRAAPV